VGKGVWGTDAERRIGEVDKGAGKDCQRGGYADRENNGFLNGIWELGTDREGNGTWREEH